MKTASPSEAQSTPHIPTIDLLGMKLAHMNQQALLDHVFEQLENGQGGWIVTANLDFLRRYAKDANVRTLYDAADIRVADGMPLIWASRAQGQPLPERIAGSSLVGALARTAAARGRSLYLLGGNRDAGARARQRLQQTYPELEVKGVACPWFSAPPTTDEIDEVAAELSRVRPDVALVGLGSPKQEQVIDALRDRLPGTWMIGVGVSFSFLAGDLARAPAWMQRAGLEWVHRLLQEPRRLARRYLVEDLPFALTLFSAAISARSAQKRRGTTVSGRSMSR